MTKLLRDAQRLRDECEDDYHLLGRKEIFLKHWSIFYICVLKNNIIDVDHLILMTPERAHHSLVWLRQLEMSAPEIYRYELLYASWFKWLTRTVGYMYTPKIEEYLSLVTKTHSIILTAIEEIRAPEMDSMNAIYNSDASQ